MGSLWLGFIWPRAGDDRICRAPQGAIRAYCALSVRANWTWPWCNDPGFRCVAVGSAHCRGVDADFLGHPRLECPVTEQEVGWLACTGLRARVESRFASASAPIRGGVGVAEAPPRVASHVGGGAAGVPLQDGGVCRARYVARGRYHGGQRTSSWPRRPVPP